jgi:hypothetical protein
LSLLRKERFDYGALRRDIGELETVAPHEPAAAPVPASVS